MTRDASQSIEDVEPRRSVLNRQRKWEQACSSRLFLSLSLFPHATTRSNPSYPIQLVGHQKATSETPSLNESATRTSLASTSPRVLLLCRRPNRSQDHLNACAILALRPSAACLDALSMSALRRPLRDSCTISRFSSLLNRTRSPLRSLALNQRSIR